MVHGRSSEERDADFKTASIGDAVQSEPYGTRSITKACGSILNAAELRGKICVVTRGTCFFSQKTLACQKAGAIATIIIDTEFEPLAAVSWVGAHENQSMLIPTIVLPLLQGNRLLSAMYDGNVRALIEAYECRPAAKCQRCAPGFTSVETSARRQVSRNERNVHVKLFIERRVRRARGRVTV